MPIPESRNTNTSKQIWMSTMAELFPRESILSDSFTNHNTGNYLRHGINITTNRGCPQHSGETGTRLSSSIHKRLLSRYFLREGDACTQARIYQRDMIQVFFFICPAMDLHWCSYAMYFQDIQTPRSKFKRRDKFGLTTIFPTNTECKNCNQQDVEKLHNIFSTCVQS